MCSRDSNPTFSRVISYFCTKCSDIWYFLIRYGIQRIYSIFLIYFLLQNNTDEVQNKFILKSNDLSQMAWKLCICPYQLFTVISDLVIKGRKCCLTNSHVIVCTLNWIHLQVKFACFRPTHYCLFWNKSLSNEKSKSFRSQWKMFLVLLFS